MGLAAPQARLLMLTARRNDVEARLMTLANQKIALSHESSLVSKEYQEALNATKFVWSADGSNSNLSYSLFNPLNYDDYNYMLTNAGSGAVVLNSATCTTLGLSAGGGSGSAFRSAVDEDTFLAKMLGVQKADIEPALEAFNLSNDDGDSTPIIKFATAYSDYNVYEYLAENCTISADQSADDDSKTWTEDEDAVGSTSYSYIGADTANVINVCDLNTQSQTALAVQDCVGDICDDVAEALSASVEDNFGSLYSSVAELIETAQDYADRKTKSYYAAKSSLVDMDTGNWQNEGIENARNTTNIEASEYGDQSPQTFIDANQVIKVYLNYFDAACKNLNATGSADGTTYTTGSKAGSTDGGTSSGNINGYPVAYLTDSALGNSIGYSSATRTLKSGAGTGNGTASVGTIAGTYVSSTGTTAGTIINSDKLIYYMSLYDELADNGWEAMTVTTNEDSALQNKLIYGSYVMKQYSGLDAFWDTVGSNDTNSPISQEASDDVDEAESTYNAEKSKLAYKEQVLDVQSNQLDSERSEITTEIESINNVLKQHFEDFKIFQNG